MANNPYANKINFGNQTLIDLTSDTVTPSDVRQGVTFHDKSGEGKTGTLTISEVEGVWNRPERHYQSAISKVYKLSQIKNDLSVLQDSSKRYFVRTCGTILSFKDCTSIVAAECAGLNSFFNQPMPNSYVQFSGCTNLEAISVIGFALDSNGLSGTKIENLDLSKVCRVVNNQRRLYGTDNNRNFGICRDMPNLKSVILETKDTHDLFYSINSTNKAKSLIGKGCFENDSLLDEVIGLEFFTTIQDYAFANCTSLDLTIPNTVTSIGTNAFLNVPHITYYGTATGAPWGALSMN